MASRSIADVVVTFAVIAILVAAAYVASDYQPPSSGTPVVQEIAMEHGTMVVLAFPNGDYQTWFVAKGDGGVVGLGHRASHIDPDPQGSDFSWSYVNGAGTMKSHTRTTVTREVEDLKVSSTPRK